MNPGGAIAPAVHLGCLRLPLRGTARMRRRWPHSAPETRLPHSPDAWQPGIPIKDAHDADEWRKWRRDRILAASETVGVGW